MWLHLGQIQKNVRSKYILYRIWHIAGGYTYCCPIAIAIAMESLGQDTSGDINELKEALTKAKMAEAVRNIYFKKRREKTKLLDAAKALMKGLHVHFENIRNMCTRFSKALAEGDKALPGIGAFMEKMEKIIATAITANQEVSSKLSRDSKESATDEEQMKIGRKKVAEYKAEVDAACNEYLDLKDKVTDVAKIIKEEPTPDSADTLHHLLSEMVNTMPKDVAAAVGHRESARSGEVRSDRIEWTTAAMCPNSRAVQDGASFLQHGESHRPYKALSSSWAPFPIGVGLDQQNGS